MARSRKKVPITGVCSGSDSWNKRKANRRLRRLVRADVVANADLTLRAVSNVWSFKKDGKQYWDTNHHIAVRK